jgi:hypothetical protein
MKNEKILAILIVCEFMLGMSGLVAEAALEPLLPAPLRAYLAVDAAGTPKLAAALLTTLWAAVVVGTVLAWLGLVNRLKPARPLYVGSWAGYLLLISLRGPNVSSSVGYALDMMMALVGGMIVGVVYFSDLAPKFRNLPRSADGLVERSA